MKPLSANISLLQTGGFRCSRLSSIQSSSLNGNVVFIGPSQRAAGRNGPLRPALCLKQPARGVAVFRKSARAFAPFPGETLGGCRATDVDGAPGAVEPHCRKAIAPRAARVESRHVGPAQQT